MRGAGGTEGGLGRFMIGLAMMVGGGYLFFNSIQVYHGWGGGLYHFGGFAVTSGMIMIPFLFGVGMLFYNSKNFVGWLLTFGSLIALAFGVLSSIQFRFAPMSSMNLIIILVLLFGGLGLFLSSLRDYGAQDRAGEAGS